MEFRSNELIYKSFEEAYRDITPELYQQMREEIDKAMFMPAAFQSTFEEPLTREKFKAMVEPWLKEVAGRGPIYTPLIGMFDEVTLKTDT